MSMNLDKLAKTLTEIAGYRRQGLISKEVFETQLFSECPPALKHLWTYYADNDSKADKISEEAFINQTEQILARISDKEQVQFYLKIFSRGREMVDQSSFKEFLRSAYLMYRALRKLGNEDDPDASSPTTSQWLETVFRSTYHTKREMSVFFLTNWILTNTPRLVSPMHKYIETLLATRSWHLSSGSKDKSKISKEPAAASDPATVSTPAGSNDNAGNEEDIDDACSKLIHPVLMWLLRSSLPTKFLSVLNKKPDESLVQQSGAKSVEQLMQFLASKNTTESWTLLYDSDDQGLSVNRFQHHVFNYRGPTLMFVKGEDDYLFCIASDVEWRESCHFWGGEDSMLLILKPEFKIVERGAKLLYSNFAIRGYPFGIQVGKNPKNLSIEIKPDFNYVSYMQIPCKLIRFLAWGCAPPEVKISQSDLRKWEEKQAEKNKKINLNNPEWKDNPDKYLLELAGNYKSYDNQ